MLMAFATPIRSRVAYEGLGPLDLTPGKPKCSLTRGYASAGCTFEIWKRLTPAPLVVTPDIERIATVAANLSFKVALQRCGGAVAVTRRRGVCKSAGR